MGNRFTVLSLMFLAILASGCTDSTTGPTASEDGQAIKITEMSVGPDPVYEGTTVRAKVGLENTGNLPATIDVGQKGSNVLVNYCLDMFNIGSNGFTASTSGDKKSDNVYRLEPGDYLGLSWKLDQQGRVPIYGFDCNFKFDVPFNYSVSAFRQVQLKKSLEVEGSPKLSSKSSKGPMLLEIETVGSSVKAGSNTYLANQDGKTMTVVFRLSNKNPSESVNKGIIDIHENSLRIWATDHLKFDEGFRNGRWTVFGDYSERRCQVGEIALNIDQGKSRVISCEVPIPSSIDRPSVLLELRANANYTYIKDIGRKNIEVKRRG